nr:retrotransposon protein, putative, Ty1-copia subclass [Tanacetum cinerariifolium]
MANRGKNHADLIKKKKNTTFEVGGSGIFVIELNTILNRSWIYDTGYGTRICNTTQGLRASRKLKPRALSFNKRAKLDLDSALLWHCRLGHISKKRIEKLQHDGLLNSSDLRAFEKCVSCMSGKMARKPYTHQVERAKDLLGLIHTDVCGPFKMMSRQGASYFVTFTDDFSRYGYVYLLKHKHEIVCACTLMLRLEDLGEPANYKAALLDPESGKWLNAMNVEMQSMKDNEVWVLVELPPNGKTETFSPVADIRAVRIPIAIAAYYDYDIWQMDVKTAFLNGYLNEKVYMEQPEVENKLDCLEQPIPLALVLTQAGKFVPKPKIPPPPKRENPAKDFIYHECREIGHWKRNCPQYLAELMKKKKNIASGAGGSGIFAIELNTIRNRSWIYDTGCGTHICNTTHGLRASRKLKPWALSLNGIFEIDLSNSLTNESFVYAVSNKRAKLDLDSALLWHCRLGHISKKRIEKLQNEGLLNSSDLTAFEKCVSCMSSKMARKPYTHQVERAKDLIGLIHTDVCGPFKIMSRQGASYFVTFTDDFSRYGYVYLLKHKHEVFETFKVFQKEVENQLGKTIKLLRSDLGGEYMSQEFLDHLKDHGIIAHRTPPYTPQHNGVSERRNRTLLD